MRCRRNAEISVREVGVDVGKVRPVEQIEEFKPELEVDPFGNGCVFVEVDVGFEEVRSTELHRLLIPAARTERRDCEIGFGDSPTGEPCLVIGRLAVATRIRVVKIVTVGIVVATSRRITDSWIRS